MSRRTSAQTAAWHDLQERSSSLLDDEDVDYLHVVIHEYWATRDVDRFVLCLLSALDSPEKLALLSSVRDLLFQQDVARFDKIAQSVPAWAHSKGQRPSADKAINKTVLSTERQHKSMSSLNSSTSQRRSLDDYALAKTDSVRTGTSSASLHSLTLHRPDDGESVLGLSICGGEESNTGVFVSAVVPGSVSERSGLEVGDRLISVGGADMRRASRASAACALKGSGPVALVVRRPKDRDARQLSTSSASVQYESRAPTSPRSLSPDGNGLFEAPSMKQANARVNHLSRTPTPSQLEGRDNTQLPGEIAVATADVTLMCPFSGATKGTLTITSYRLRFLPASGKGLLLHSVPVCTVQAVEKIGRSSSRGEYSYGLEVACKDLRSLRFAFQQESHARRTVYKALYEVAFPRSLKPRRDFFAVRYKTASTGTDASARIEFDMASEFGRLGVPGAGWRLTSANKNYHLCSTYPTVIAVPSRTTDEQLIGVAAFRSRGRIPVLSWLHPENRASITRSAQPLVGLRGKHNHVDELYVQEIANANPNDQKIVVLDARPKLNALANKARGGGYEDETRYSDTEPIFLDIANIHVVRESFRKLHAICFPTTSNTHWLSDLESTHWLDHIRLILTGAVRMVDFVDKQAVSVLVHCSDGWDRTSQLCGLSMLLMDPYYRTISGFETLIEKEWLAIGHKFSQRCGHGNASAGDDQRAPIFLQFIDCVWQVMQQFPRSFEFNEDFLVRILDNVHSCLFGTFLGNCDKERVELRKETSSLWEHLEQFSDELRNPSYSGDDDNASVLRPVTSAHCLHFWTGYYTRWSPRSHSLES